MCGPFEIRAKKGAKGRIIGGYDLQPIETWAEKPEAAQFCIIIELFPPSNSCYEPPTSRSDAPLNGRNQSTHHPAHWNSVPTATYRYFSLLRAAKLTDALDWAFRTEIAKYKGLTKVYGNRKRWRVRTGCGDDSKKSP
jgi:hypothetical protein